MQRKQICVCSVFSTFNGGCPAFGSGYAQQTKSLTFSDVCSAVAVKLLALVAAAIATKVTKWKEGQRAASCKQ